MTISRMAEVIAWEGFHPSRSAVRRWTVVSERSERIPRVLVACCVPTRSCWGLMHRWQRYGGRWEVQRLKHHPLLLPRSAGRGGHHQRSSPLYAGADLPHPGFEGPMPAIDRPGHCLFSARPLCKRSPRCPDDREVCLHSPDGVHVVPHACLGW